MPILKQLVHSNHQSKRRSRADLTPEMISAPLGDFRHTMHVGRGGDAFGDTSFLSTRSGEAPSAETKRGSPGSKPSLLARTFRGSKRSHSVNRGDRYEYIAAVPPAGSANFVKNAISLPYLNLHEGSGRSQETGVSSSKPAGGPAAIATFDAEFDERNFGELTELPPPQPKSGSSLKHAESMMSFHVDLGPSMLGDILSVMDKKGLEDDDLGYEEGKGSEGHGSPAHIPLIDDDDDPPEERQPPARPPRMMIYQQKVMVAPYSPEPHTRDKHQHLDSCSVSSSGSTTEEKTPYPQHNDTDSAKYSSPRGEDDFSFMDDDEDEIRV
ncbi:cdc42 effector protein 4 [Syngnathoides biaculeatus]|uniref:cdc42 effector protein 4 n=1 Tax=Syngnathoides biaculeatus TaxID=300417 RepID=UPI002ADE02DE|nr:cdc42 effector protein 4 [Syngnathoides biaculeatus]XP_061666940.1 cdc42 effector protein 4 [Syngnathoides biaculeatus]XP_061666941.1 cdc42 effector protein 4 [Syngnathoides biaculeatus]